MRKLLSDIKNAIEGAVGLNEVFVFGGILISGYGIAQIYEPAAWIVIGTIILLLGLRR